MDGAKQPLTPSRASAASKANAWASLPLTALGTSSSASPSPYGRGMPLYGLAASQPAPPRWTESFNSIVFFVSVFFVFFIIIIIYFYFYFLFFVAFCCIVFVLLHCFVRIRIRFRPPLDFRQPKSEKSRDMDYGARGVQIPKFQSNFQN